MFSSVDVQNAIRSLRPDGVFLELPDTEGVRKHVKRTQFGPKFGWSDEFHTAYESAKARGIRVVLGDVPRETTRKRGIR